MKLTLLLFAAWSCGASDVVRQYLQTNDARYVTFKSVVDLLDARKARILVETRVSVDCPVDGCSSLILGAWSKHNRAQFHVVDVDAGRVQRARTLLSISTVVHASPVVYLQAFAGEIDLLHLTSAAHPNNHVIGQIHVYTMLMAAYDKLHKESIVLVEGFDQPYHGVARLAVEYLVENKWQAVHTSQHVLLVYIGNALTAPTVRPTPMRKSLREPRVQGLAQYVTCPLPYQWVKAKDGDMPRHAFRATGDQGDPQSPYSCYVGRLFTLGTVVHGCIVPQKAHFEFPHSTAAHTSNVYEALAVHPSHRVEWVPARLGQAPKNAIRSGSQFIGRIMYYGMWIVGKIEPACRCIYVVLQGREQFFHEYDVLTLVL
jgi:hypothetical protein